MSVIYPLNQGRVYTGINHTISNIRNYWRKCLSLKKKKSLRVYNSDEHDYIIKTKPATKPKTKTEEDIYTRFNYECKECHEEFRNKIALTTRSYSNNRKYLENTEDFDINSSQNMRILYYR